MKRRLAATVTGVVSVLAATGFAIAQSTWVTIGEENVEICRPVFAEVHRLEQEFLLDQIDLRCTRGTADYSAEVCAAARDLLQSTRAVDDVAWFVSGNEQCDNGSPYPCYGAAYFNTPRTGRDAQRAIAEIREEAKLPARITADMNFHAAAPIGDRCMAQQWIAKYDGAPAPGRSGAQSANNPNTSGQNSKARGKNQRAGGPAASAPTSKVSQDDLDDCIDGVAPLQTCSAMLAGLPQGDPAFIDLAFSLMVRELAEGRSIAAIDYGDMIAARRQGQDAALVRCTVRVLSKWDLDTALRDCNAAGVEDAGVVELRGQIHLLAGRWNEAWSDFDAAYAASKGAQALFLRGLASAGMGRMADAVKDLGQAEQQAPGTTEAFETDGYSLAAVTPRKPMLGPEAFAPMGAPPAADPAAAPPAPAAPPAQAPRATPSAPRAGAVTFAPDAPRGQLAPLTSARLAECDNAMRGAQTASETWKGTPEEKALRLGQIQRTLFAGRCAGHAQAAALVTDAERSIAISASSAAAAITSSADTSPDAISCVEPMVPSDPRNTTGAPALRNSCAYPVQVAYCNVSPAKGSWAETFACGVKGALAVDTIPANSATPAVFGREVQHFACRAPAGPVLTYEQGKGLDGFCK